MGLPGTGRGGTGNDRFSRLRDTGWVEKCFDALKNNLFLKRLRVHSGDGVEGLLFIEFVALIIRSQAKIKC
jgi:transposase